MKEFFDATVFLGMHSSDEKIRIACKGFFTQKIQKTLWMSLEEVGRCDDVIWRFPRKIQDAYYPFMDNLHTIMKIRRIEYNSDDVKHALNMNNSLNMSRKLVIGMAKNRKGTLYTFDKKLLNLKLDFVRSPEIIDESKFPKIEKLYKESLKLRI